jgi:hypothetical protein
MAEFYRRTRAPAMFLSGGNFRAKIGLALRKKILFNGREIAAN